MKAQSFNTITNSRPHYKVELSVMSKPMDKPSVVDNINTDTSLTSKQSKAITIGKEQIRYPLSVSYPLRQSKLHVSSPYGYRRHPILGFSKMHNGIDLRATREPVYAMLPGKVVKTGYDNISGNYVTLQHASMRVSYCHLSVIGVEVGMPVYAGQSLGITGNTGRSTGPHLHLTLKVNGEICNPTILLNYIDAKIRNSNTKAYTTN